ncbi:MAG: hypothetical protein H7095_05480, partial [Pseudopedobacter sp.]|nr:hypothetical protein [Deinococcales bacterium]
KTLKKDPNSLHVIHYSCETFYGKPDSFSPTIVAVAVRKYLGGQTTTFSLAEKREELIYKGNQNPDIKQVELEMLNDLFRFFRQNMNSLFVHWNMRSSQYGFKAIEHRYRILGGQPISLPENNLYDLADIFRAIYEKGYIEDPKLESLAKKNELGMRHFMAGGAEADAFDQGMFSDIKLSTIKKVEIISYLLEYKLQAKLKTNARFNLVEFIKDIPNNPFYIILSLFAIFGTFYGLYIAFFP